MANVKHQTRQALGLSSSYIPTLMALVVIAWRSLTLTLDRAGKLGRLKELGWMQWRTGWCACAAFGRRWFDDSVAATAFSITIVALPACFL